MILDNIYLLKQKCQVKLSQAYQKINWIWRKFILIQKVGKIYIVFKRENPIKKVATKWNVHYKK